ncbi:MAG: BtpA/SgcQ family protein [Patescibacteria group bacterium]
MNIFKELFSVKKPIIGMIHLPPLAGYDGHRPIAETRRRILTEAGILEERGVHGIMIENNYSVPHREFIKKAEALEMKRLVHAVTRAVKIPVGVDVLWSGYQSALVICKETGARFVRVASFVDDVMTQYGPMPARGAEAVAERKKLGLEDSVAILADVQVKHSHMMDPKKPLRQSVREAVDTGADAIIVTGTWTGVAPIMKDLHIARRFGRGLPIVVGSGSTPETLHRLFTGADAIIVGSAIMTDKVVDAQKLSSYMDSYRSLRVRNFRKVRYNKEEL